MLEGFAKAHPDKVRRLETERVLVRRDAPIKGKVGIVTGGGSGHKPAFIGYIGKGLVDAVAVGDIFSAPPVSRVYEAIKAFGMARELAESEGIPVESIIVNDDVASSPKGREENRRGVAGEVVLWKVVGALAEEGADLEKLKEVGERVVRNTRSMIPCILPTAGKPGFTISEDEMEIGVGHHGEPGIKRTKMMSADEVTTLMLEEILKDLPFEAGDEVLVLINGLGSTSLLEMYIAFRKVAAILADCRIRMHRTYIGEFFTSLEIGGFSITLTRLDDELKRLVDAPCDGVHFVQH